MAAGTRGARSVIVLGSTDNAVRILDLSAQQLEPLVGHTDWVCAVDVATVDRLDVVVSGSDDGSVRLWDLATRRPIRTLPTGDIGSVRALAVVDDSPSPTLVLGSRNREVRAVPLDLEGGQVKVLDEMSDAIQSVGVVRVGDKWATFARDDSGAMAARLLPEGIEFPPPLSGAGEVGGVATIGPGSSIYTGHPRVAVASREVVTVSEWREEAWHLVAAPDLGSDVLALDFDETGQQLLVGARQGVALINLAPSPPAPSELATALPPHGSETGL